MDWNRYKDLERQEVDLKRANPVMVEFSYEEFQVLMFGIMLLRRVQGNTKDGDLGIVDKKVTPAAAKIAEALRAVPGTAELRAERSRMLAERLDVSA